MDAERVGVDRKIGLLPVQLPGREARYRERRFQDAGHRPIALAGGATGWVGVMAYDDEGRGRRLEGATVRSGAVIATTDTNTIVPGSAAVTWARRAGQAAGGGPWSHPWGTGEGWTWRSSR